MSDLSDEIIPEPISDAIFAWKFIIGATPVPDPDNPSCEWTACVTVCLARTEEEARKRLQAYSEYHGAPAGWLKVARVVKIPLREGAVLTWYA